VWSKAKRAGPLAILAVVLGTGWACHGMTAGAGDATIVTAVTPAGGVVGVDPDAVVEIAFSSPMQAGMEAYAALHVGPVTGPEVPGMWSWADDRTRLRFAPEAFLAGGMQYTIHLGGGMMDAAGRAINYQSCVDQYGGMWATAGRMSGGMMAGRDMMGDGWRDANGTYGMLFPFRTR